MSSWLPRKGNLVIATLRFPLNWSPWLPPIASKDMWPRTGSPGAGFAFVHAAVLLLSPAPAAIPAMSRSRTTQLSGRSAVDASNLTSSFSSRGSETMSGLAVFHPGVLGIVCTRFLVAMCCHHHYMGPIGAKGNPGMLSERTRLRNPWPRKRSSRQRLFSVSPQVTAALSSPIMSTAIAVTTAESRASSCASSRTR